MQNLFSALPERLYDELVGVLVRTGAVRFERIGSLGQATPPSEWLDQAQDEWVVLLRGRAALAFADEAGPIEMRPGGHLIIPARRRHRVEWTDPHRDRGTLATMHSDVDWPNGMEGGYVRGHNAVRDYWKCQWAIIDPHVEPLRFEADETGSIVVDVHRVVRDLAGNVKGDQIVQHLYRICDGLITTMEIRTNRGDRPCRR